MKGITNTSLRGEQVTEWYIKEWQFPTPQHHSYTTLKSSGYHSYFIFGGPVFRGARSGAVG